MCLIVFAVFVCCVFDVRLFLLVLSCVVCVVAFVCLECVFAMLR